MSETKNKDNRSIIGDLLGDSWPENKKKTPDSKQEEAKIEKPNPRPTLETIGMADCSVCKAAVSVVLTKSGHPFTACGKCGARTFFNSRVAIDILKKQTRSL